jgi:hypothetical protein
MLVKFLIFAVLFYGITYKLNYKELDTKLKCGRFVGAFLSCITIFSPQITYDNNAMFVVFFPFFFIIGFVFGFIYRAIKPYKGIIQKELEVEERVEEKIVIETEHFVLAKKAAIVFFILIAVTMIFIIFR